MPSATGHFPASERLRVGIVGANPGRSWAKDSHVPAIAQSADLVLSAVATRSEASARAAAQAFGVGTWFADAFSLVRSNAVDIVSVCVRVPEHRAIVLAALAAGKHVYCEWPLGRDVAEAREMADTAEAAGVHCAVGLQGRLNPAVRSARELLDAGALGRLLSARVVSTTAGYAPQLPSTYAYLNRAANGANLTTILGGHTLDLAVHLLGPVVSLDALSAIQFPEVWLSDIGGILLRDTPDHLLVLRRHESGCVLSAEVGGNRPAETAFSFEIVGTSGRLALRGGHPHGFQAGDLRLEADVPFAPLDPPAAVGGLAGAAANVAEVYASLARDIREGTCTAPDFAHAARLSDLLDTVRRAAETGVRQHAAGRPLVRVSNTRTTDCGRGRRR